ncbi:MAG TPA: hypothetical protein PLM74_10170 [Bacillota bacterium]|mgnify:CR=1 FL=1|nr:hypothetical protein [Bacillota bacterium]
MRLASARTRRCCMLMLAVLCAALVGALSPSAHAAPLITPDDWRYTALVELGRAGLLDERDAGVYASGVPVSLGDLSLTVERTIRHLAGASVGGEISVSGSVALSPGPLRLTGPIPTNLTISATQANLIARLVDEFGPTFSDQSLANLSLGVPFRSPGGGMVLSLSESALPLPSHRLLSDIGAYASVSTAPASMRPPASQPELVRLQDLLTPSVRLGSEDAEPRFQAGVPSPLGTLAVEMSSQAARRPGKDDTGEERQPTRGFDLSTSVRLADILKVSADFFTDDKSPQKPTSTALGVVLGETEGAGLSVGHRVTDMGAGAANTGGLRETVTSVDVKYSLPDVVGRAVSAGSTDSITVRAGYELYGREQPLLAAKSSLQATASVVIDYKLLLGDAAFLQAGYRYERIRDLIASGAVWTKSEMYGDGGLSAWPGIEPLKLDGSDATRTVTSIDFGYRLMGDTSLLLGYKLIDFSDIGALDFTKNLATAEVTIRF